jgi:hypothetical protein
MRETVDGVVWWWKLERFTVEQNTLYLAGKTAPW